MRGANYVLDQRIGTIWVEGEVESVNRASSGHVYFCLKDARSQLKAVLWRADAARLKFAIENGQSLLCRGRMAVYDRDGKLQLYVDAAEPAGLGAEALAFEQLKARLAADGLFAAERKRPLPLVPRRIGVVTSKSGAAVRDIIRAVERRFPVPILIADTRVQGPNAPPAIARAMAAGALGPCTLVSAIKIGTGKRRSTALMTSRTAAPLFEVTTPMRRGRSGSGRFFSAANSPSAASRALSCSSASASAPSPAGSAAST